MRQVLLGFCAAALLTRSSAASGASPRPTLDIARAFPDGGGYVWSGGSGAPCDIEHEGAPVLRAQDKGTYCSGFTFAVVMQAAAERGLLQGKSLAAVRGFQKQWYGAVEAAAERQCAYAVERLGIGQEVDLAAAEPGDFVQLWRVDKSGHSVVLVELIREGSEIIGLRYRSSQRSTDGIGEREEFFADAPARQGKLDRRRIYVARLWDEPQG